MLFVNLGEKSEQINVDCSVTAPLKNWLICQDSLVKGLIPRAIPREI